MISTHRRHWPYYLIWPGRVNRLRDEDNSAALDKAAVLKKLANVLGLLEQDAEQYLQSMP